MRIKRLHSQRLLVGMILALAASVVFPPRAVQAAPLTPYQIKVGYIYNFAIYAEWPKAAFATTNAPFVLGVFGQDPFGEDLGFIQRKTIKNRPVVIKYFKKIEEVRECHILFISQSEKAQLPQLSKALAQASVLTVSEVDGFIEQDGMVNFVTVKRAANVETIGFQINQAAVEKAGLRIHSQVLRMRENKE